MNIKAEIKDYLRGPDNCGALLLTGQWGSGKSHLVGEITRELAKEDSYAFAVISLFGIDNVALLTERIRDLYLEKTSFLLGKTARKAYKALHKVASTSAKVASTALSASPSAATAAAIAAGISSVSSFNPLVLCSVKNTIKTRDKERRFILIFDDLERCTISYRILLGVINEYTENRKIHTILIADETNIPAEHQEAYSLLKDKIISRTIKLLPNQESTIRSILGEYSDSLGEYKQFLLENFSTLNAAFTHSTYNNFRMLKACIFDFRRIFIAWKQANLPEPELPRIFYSFCAMTYEYRCGNFKRTILGTYSILGKSEDNQERHREEQAILDKYFDEPFNNKLFSIARWVVEGEWNETLFLDEVNKRYNPVGQTRDERFITQLFWDLEQEDINEGLPIILEKGYTGQLDCNELLELLRKLHALRENQFSFPCDASYSKLEDGLDIRRQKLRDNAIQEPKQRNNVETHEIDEEAIPIYQRISRFRNQLASWKTRRMFLQFINGEGHITAYDIRDTYMDCFDDTFHMAFLTAFKRVSNQKRREMCNILIRMDFHNERFSSIADQRITLQNLESLAAEVQELLSTFSDEISKALTTSFISNLQKETQVLKSLVSPDTNAATQDCMGSDE